MTGLKAAEHDKRALEGCELAVYFLSFFRVFFDLFFSYLSLTQMSSANFFSPLDFMSPDSQEVSGNSRGGSEAHS